MSDSDRRSFLKATLVVIVGGAVTLGDEAIRLIDDIRWRYVLPGVDDAAEDMNEREPTPQGDNTSSLKFTTPSRESGGLQTDNGEFECTSARIEDFDWQSTDTLQDLFTGTLINQSDIAGSVDVSLSFYRTEQQGEQLKMVSESVAIGAQDVRDVEIEAFPPEDAEYAVMSVEEQECSLES